MKTKSPKTPPISSSTKLLSFDLETNGLHGQAFAIGAVVMNASGEVLDEFTARCKLNSEVDEWVQANVLPSIKDMPETHGDYKTMREAFWRWYEKTEPEADYVVVSNGYPVEYRFLLDCQEADLEKRYWQHPFPILDLTSLLLQVKPKLNENKTEILNKANDGQTLLPHHPLHDAKATALLAFEAFKQAGLL